MKVLTVGGGARENVIVKKLADDGAEIYAAMGNKNPGIARLSEEYLLESGSNIEEVVNWAVKKDVKIAVIGPEAPLGEGIVDALEEDDIKCASPTKDAAKIETSKEFMRNLMGEHELPGRVEYHTFDNIEDIEDFLSHYEGDLAVKPDVLTGGKGVKVSGEHLRNSSEIIDYALKRIETDGLVVLEEKLEGKEFTLQAFTDGKRIEVMPLVRDFKRAYDGDKGPNTGSMGSFSCPDHGMPDLTSGVVEEGIEIMRRTIDVTRRITDSFQGILYGGFMVTQEGVFLLEYNVRFGDPEAINVLSLLENPSTEVGFGIAEGNLPKVKFLDEATVCVYLVPQGYPVDPLGGEPIEVGDIENSEMFYASVIEKNGEILTTGSRAIALLGKGDTVKTARDKVYGDITKISGKLHYRKDIAKDI